MGNCVKFDKIKRITLILPIFDDFESIFMKVFLTIVTLIAMVATALYVMRLALQLLGYFGRWVDSKFLSVQYDDTWTSAVLGQYKPTYPAKYESPVFNQTYSKERAAEKQKTKYPKPSYCYPKSTTAVQPKTTFTQSSISKHKNDYKPPLNLIIEYYDVDGVYTKREIRVTQYRANQQWNNSIVGYCKLRGEERQFNAN
jgi:hypothetical protein